MFKIIFFWEHRYFSSPITDVIITPHVGVSLATGIPVSFDYLFYFYITDVPDDHISVREVSPLVTELTIHDIQPMDSGVYTCHVGSSINTLTVDLQDNGKFPTILFLKRSHKTVYLTLTTKVFWLGTFLIFPKIRQCTFGNMPLS